MQTRPIVSVPPHLSLLSQRSDVLGGTEAMGERTAKARTLTRESIIETAKLLVKAHGIDVSMRALGDELGVSQMAVYRHFENRDALITDVVNDVLGDALSEEAMAALYDAHENAKERCLVFCCHLFDSLAKYPGLAQHLQLGASLTPNGMRLVGLMVSFLQGQGLSQRRSAEIFQVVSMFISQALFLDHAIFVGESKRANMLATARELKAAFPDAADIIEVFGEISVRARMVTGLRLFLNAVELEIEAEKGAHDT